jgi:hypothetical protein
MTTLINNTKQLICVLVLVFPINCFSQNGYFEGRITYQHKSLLKNGDIELFPIDKEQTYFRKGQVLNRVISGFIKERVGNKPIYLDTEKMLRYQIDNEEKVINDLGHERDLELIKPIEFKQLNRARILNENCDVYFIKYVHNYDSMSFDGSKNRIDTLRCTYFISSEMKIFNPKKIAYLTANRSSKFIDGRFDGIPLRVVIERSTGRKFIIEAVKIEKQDFSLFVDLPKYPIKNIN